jgi:hypothetical protein
MIVDLTARHIYDHAHRDAINSWLRTLASIRDGRERVRSQAPGLRRR